MSDYPVSKSDAQWRAQLSHEEYVVLRKGGTERAWRGEYTDTETKGVYRCKGCNARLFSSDAKFHSQSGWPSFYAPLPDGAVDEKKERTFLLRRTEVVCATCGSHLGHVFKGEGFRTPTDLRYCINSISLVLDPESPEGDENEGDAA